MALVVLLKGVNVGGHRTFRPSSLAAQLTVLFHEIGHHLNATLGAPGRSDEPAAETWSRALHRSHFRSR